MPRRVRTLVCAHWLFAALTFAGAALAQSPPNPYRQVEGWAKLTGGRQIGAVGDVIAVTRGYVASVITVGAPMFPQAPPVEAPKARPKRTRCEPTRPV